MEWSQGIQLVLGRGSLCTGKWPGGPKSTGTGLSLYLEVARGFTLHRDRDQSVQAGVQNGPLQAQSPGVGGAVKALPREGEGHQQLSVLATCVWQPKVEGVHIGAGLWQG